MRIHAAFLRVFQRAWSRFNLTAPYHSQLQNPSTQRDLDKKKEKKEKEQIEDSATKGLWSLLENATTLLEHEN